MGVVSLLPVGDLKAPCTEAIQLRRARAETRITVMQESIILLVFYLHGRIAFLYILTFHNLSSAHGPECAPRKSHSWSTIEVKEAKSPQDDSRAAELKFSIKWLGEGESTCGGGQIPTLQGRNLSIMIVPGMSLLHVYL